VLYCTATRYRLISYAALSAGEPSSRDGRYRPLSDIQELELEAGKRPFIRDGARFALRVAGLGLSRLGEGRKPGTSHASRCPQHLPPVFPYVLERM